MHISSFVGPTVFHGLLNFEPSHGILIFSRNFVEFCRKGKFTGD